MSKFYHVKSARYPAGKLYAIYNNIDYLVTMLWQELCADSVPYTADYAKKQLANIKTKDTKTLTELWAKITQKNIANTSFEVSVSAGKMLLFRHLSAEEFHVLWTKQYHENQKLDAEIESRGRILNATMKRN